MEEVTAEKSRQTLNAGDVLFSGEDKQCLVTRVTAKQFKMREIDRWSKEFSGYEQSRPLDEFGFIWFATFEEAIIAAYRCRIALANAMQRDADSARGLKLKMREKYASILTGIDG